MTKSLSAILVLFCTMLTAQPASSGASELRAAPSSLGGIVQITPPVFNFGAQKVGTTVARTVALTNVGSATVFINSIAFVGSGNVFSQTNTCGASLAVGARCTLTVTWFVSLGKLKNTKCDIGDTAINGPQQIPIIGFGV